jgi:hypothetical protein
MKASEIWWYCEDLITSAQRLKHLIQRRSHFIGGNRSLR